MTAESGHIILNGNSVDPAQLANQDPRHFTFSLWQEIYKSKIEVCK